MSKPSAKEAEKIVNDLSELHHRMYKVLKWNGGDSKEMSKSDTREEVDNPLDADVITSAVKHMPRHHTIMLDLDVPAKLVESSTPGHSHLYIDVPVTWDQLSTLLYHLSRMGVIEKGYEGVSLKNKCTSLRLPWVKKDNKPDEDFPLEEVMMYGKAYVRKEGSNEQWQLKK